jgi:hypothetical protein
MREILFRGKGINTGEWRYGAYYNGVHGEGLSKIYEPHKEFIIDEHTEVFHRVLPETVGQYIGKDSRNGFLFTGDIICPMSLIDFPLYEESHGWEMYNAEVIVEKACYKASFTRLNKTVALYELKRFEVIGNIHDNPELLEEEQV